MGTKIKHNVGVYSGIVASVLLFLMLVVATLQMLSNRLGVVGFNYAYAIRCLMIWSFMLGAVYCFGKGKHIAFTLLLEKFPKGRGHFVLELISNVLILFFIILVFIVGSVLAFGKDQDIFLVYLVLPVSGLLISTISIVDISEVIRKLRSGVEL